MSRSDSTLRQTFDAICHVLPEAGDIFDHISKCLSMEVAYNEMLENAEHYLETHRADTKKLVATQFQSDEAGISTPPIVAVSVRRAACGLIQKIHSYDEFLKKLEGRRITSPEDFELLDILRNYVEHGANVLAMRYASHTRQSPLRWDLVVDLVTTMEHLERAGELMSEPKLEELAKLADEDGTINLSQSFEFVLDTATKKYIQISKLVSAESDNSIMSLHEAVAKVVETGSDPKETSRVVDEYAEDNAERSRLSGINRELTATWRQLAKQSWQRR